MRIDWEKAGRESCETHGTLLLLNHLEFGETQNPMSSSSSSVIVKKICSLIIISVPNQCCCPWEQTWHSNSPLQQQEKHKPKNKKLDTQKSKQEKRRKRRRERKKERNETRKKYVMLINLDLQGHLQNVMLKSEY